MFGESKLHPAVLGQCFSKTVMIAQSDLLLAAGDRVILGLDEYALLWASILGYLLPILSLSISMGAIFGEAMPIHLHLENVEQISIIFALLGFVLSFLFNRWIIVIYLRRYRIQPAILRKL